MVIQFELVPDEGPHVLGLVHQLVQEGDQLHQLIIGPVHKPRLNWDSILQLVTKGLKKNNIYLNHFKYSVPTCGELSMMTVFLKSLPRMFKSLM